MTTMLVFKKFTLEEAVKNMYQIEAWFRENPTRKVCNTDLFKVKKGYLVQDILKHTEDYMGRKEKPRKPYVS